MLNIEEPTLKEFIEQLKHSKNIVFRDEFDDVKIFISGYGRKFKIIKVKEKKGVVVTKVDGFQNTKIFEIKFLKFWLDEYKLKLEN